MPAPSDPAVAHFRSSVARRCQSYSDDHPKVSEARQALDYAKLADQAAKVIANWPDPTKDQLQKVAAILTAGPPRGDGDA
jgi:hypothetical protein